MVYLICNCTAHFTRPINPYYIIKHRNVGVVNVALNGGMANVALDGGVVKTLGGGVTKWRCGKCSTI